MVQQQKGIAERILPRVFGQLVVQTNEPFIQTRYDLSIPRMAFGIFFLYTPLYREFFWKNLAQCRAVYKFIASLFMILDMGRPNYVCTTCSEHFTRKYSAKRHNITVHHNNGGEIVPLVEYLVGRSSGRYQPSHPFWYRRVKRGIGRPTVADYVGDVPRTGGLQRQQQGQYQHQRSLEEQERLRQGQQEQSMSPSIPLSPTTIQDQPPPDALPYPTDRTFHSQPVNTSEDDLTTTLSQETRLKIAELKRLIYRHSQVN